MKTLITILLMTLPINIQAKLTAKFNYDPAQQVVINDVPTENADLKLKVYAVLDSKDDHLGMNLALGYDFRCQGDEEIAKNIAQKSSDTDEYPTHKIEYRLAKPQAWDQWSSGTSRVCYLNWTGRAIRTTTQQDGTSIGFTFGGFGSGITFTYSSSQTSAAQEKAETAQKSFTMIKPATSSGGEMCHQPF